MSCAKNIYKMLPADDRKLDIQKHQNQNRLVLYATAVSYLSFLIFARKKI